MKLTQLTIENYFGIRFFEITKMGKMNLITGDNWVGKSAVVTALKHLLEGSGVKLDLVHNDADKTKLCGIFDDGLRVERVTTRTSTKVKAFKADGSPVTGPIQAFLDALFNGYSFNPVDYFQAKPAERLKLILASAPFVLQPEVVLAAAGELAEHLDLESVDFKPHGLEVLSGIAKTVYDNRHEQGGHVLQLDRSIKQERKELPDTTDAERFETFDYQKALKDLQEAEAQIAEHREKEAKLHGLRETAISITDSIAVAKEQLTDLEGRLVKVQTEGKQVASEVKAFMAPEVETFRRDLSDYQQAQEVLSAIEAIKRRESELQGEREKHEALDSLYKILHDDLPIQALSEMKLPMKGLAIDGNRITLNGVSLDGLSDGEQLIFAIRFAKIVADKLKCICVDRWETLSKKNQKLFLAEAGVDDGFAYFFVEVTDGELRHKILGAGSA